MDYEEIQTCINAIVASMLVKGLVQPEATFYIQADMQPRAGASWKKVDGHSSYDRQYEFGKAGTPQETLAHLRQWVDALPSIEDRQRSDYAKLISKALEYGKQAGFDDVLVNPLKEAMEKLSANILPDLSDDIPF